MDDLMTYAIYAIVMVIWLLRTVSKSSKRSSESKARHRKMQEMLESPRKRRGHTITIRNVKFYKDHPSMIKIVQKYSGWDSARARSFLHQNEFLQIHNQAPYESVSIMAELNRGKVSVSTFTRNPNEDEIILKRSEVRQETNYYAPEPVAAPPPPPRERPAPVQPRQEQRHEQDDRVSAMSARLQRLAKKIEERSDDHDIHDVHHDVHEESVEVSNLSGKKGIHSLLETEDELIKGVILSEVLGKPVSER